jgi:hypothetical protein
LEGSKLFSLIFKNEAISITLIRISLLKGIWTLFDERGMSLRSFCLINHKMTILLFPIIYLKKRIETLNFYEYQVKVLAQCFCQKCVNFRSKQKWYDPESNFSEDTYTPCFRFRGN